MSDQNKLTDAFEPCAMAMAKALLNAKDQRSLDDEELVSLSAVSKAQSAKRQADYLERVAKALEYMNGEIAHPEYGIAPTLRDLGRSR